MAGPIARWCLHTFMVIMLIAGSCNTLSLKAQDRQNSLEDMYNHPYFQTACMFMGEFLCFFPYLANRFRSSQPSKPRKPGLKGRLGAVIFALPAFCDLVSTAIMLVGLGLTTASVYQMLKGLVVVVVALYSVIFLHRRLYRHQVFGVVFVFVGVVIVGVGSVFMDSGDERNPALGAILIVAGQFIGGANWVIEEKFFGDIVVPPLQAVGIEGLSGLIYFAILLPIFYYIPCYNTNMCAGSGHVENVPYAFKQVGNNGLLLFFFIGNIFSVAIFNWSSLSVTKNASSLARSTIDTSRTIVVWSVDLIIGWERFSYVQLVGFLLLAFGSFVYNEVLVLPWFGFKEAVALHREEMAKRKILVSEDTEEDMAYRLEEDGK